MQLNTVIGGFNPMMMALTYGFSTSLECYSKHVNHAKVIEDLKVIKNETEKKVNKLE